MSRPGPWAKKSNHPHHPQLPNTLLIPPWKKIGERNLKKKKNSKDGRDKAAAQTQIPARKGESDWSPGEEAVTWQQTSAHGHNRLNYLQIIFGSTTHFESSQKASCAAAPDWLLGQSRSCRALYWSCKKKKKKFPEKQTEADRRKCALSSIRLTLTDNKKRPQTMICMEMYASANVLHLTHATTSDTHNINIQLFFRKNELQEKAANSGAECGRRVIIILLISAKRTMSPPCMYTCKCVYILIYVWIYIHTYIYT